MLDRFLRLAADRDPDRKIGAGRRLWRAGVPNRGRTSAVRDGGAQAQALKTISEALMEHDTTRKEPGSDYLREALAAHYSGMVTMCVTCHNQYRPLAAK